MVAAVIAGPVAVLPRVGGKEEIFAIFGGLLEVKAGTVRLLADAAEHISDLVHDEIEAALQQAQALRSAARDRHELHRAQELVDRQVVRLEVARLRRRHRERPGRSSGGSS
jgi:F0F1-type ATP synthase epsilon subunit